MVTLRRRAAIVIETRTATSIPEGVKSLRMSIFTCTFAHTMGYKISAYLIN